MISSNILYNVHEVPAHDTSLHSKQVNSIMQMLFDSNNAHLLNMQSYKSLPLFTANNIRKFLILITILALLHNFYLVKALDDKLTFDVTEFLKYLYDEPKVEPPNDDYIRAGKNDIIKLEYLSFNLLINMKLSLLRGGHLVRYDREGTLQEMLENMHESQWCREMRGWGMLLCLESEDENSNQTKEK